MPRAYHVYLICLSCRHHMGWRMMEPSAALAISVLLTESLNPYCSCTQDLLAAGAHAHASVALAPVQPMQPAQVARLAAWGLLLGRCAAGEACCWGGVLLGRVAAGEVCCTAQGLLRCHARLPCVSARCSSSLARIQHCIWPSTAAAGSLAVTSTGCCPATTCYICCTTAHMSEQLAGTAGTPEACIPNAARLYRAALESPQRCVPATC
jgi:hypothetical protein